MLGGFAIGIFVAALVSFCLDALAQTNPVCAKGLVFSLPPVPLRDVSSREQTQTLSPQTCSGDGWEISTRALNQRRVGSLLGSSSVTDQNNVEKRETAFEAQTYGAVGGEVHFCLTRPEPRSKIEAIFEPEVVSFGKAKLTCSLLTAIKRKNPLCLINPIFLQLSW